MPARPPTSPASPTGCATTCPRPGRPRPPGRQRPRGRRGRHPGADRRLGKRLPGSPARGLPRRPGGADQRGEARAGIAGHGPPRRHRRGRQGLCRDDRNESVGGTRDPEPRRRPRSRRAADPSRGRLGRIRVRPDRSRAGSSRRGCRCTRRREPVTHPGRRSATTRPSCATACGSSWAMPTTSRSSGRRPTASRPSPSPDANARRAPHGRADAAARRHRGDPGHRGRPGLRGRAGARPHDVRRRRARVRRAGGRRQRVPPQGRDAGGDRPRRSGWSPPASPSSRRRSPRSWCASSPVGPPGTSAASLLDVADRAGDRGAPARRAGAAPTPRSPTGSSSAPPRPRPTSAACWPSSALATAPSWSSLAYEAGLVVPGT